MDFLAEFTDGKSLLYLARPKVELEERLKMKVYVLTYHSLHPFLKEILKKQELIA